MAIATRPLGRTGLEVTTLGFGGAPMGELYTTLGEDDAQAAIAAAYDSGVRYFDTAPWYGHGLSEHRLGHHLRQQARDTFALSTKVGRVYRRPEDPTQVDRSPWAGGLPFVLRFDYTRDGIMRSYEDSLMRLGLNRVDLLLIHDLDVQYHGADGIDARLEELDRGGGFRALEGLKANGEIKGIGAGINEAGMIARFLERFDLDFFLVAMPYTLLDQDVLDDVFPACSERGIGFVIGAPYASGILATGPKPGAKYNYGDAPAGVMDRARRMENVCRRHGVPLAAAALQFPLGHASVASVIPGAASAAQVRQNLDMLQWQIPVDFWEALKRETLIREDAPVP